MKNVMEYEPYRVNMPNEISYILNKKNISGGGISQDRLRSY